jgi:lipopolysaccharide/colanic/teichoic acid biosynthesis glycosyltransferase
MDILLRCSVGGFVVRCHFGVAIGRPGSIFYQERWGRKVCFRVYKLRSMVQDAEAIPARCLASVVTYV